MEKHELMRAMEHCVFDHDCYGCPLQSLDAASDCLEAVCKASLEEITKKQLEIEKLQRNEGEVIKAFVDKILNQISRNHTISADWMRKYLRDMVKEYNEI